MKFLVKSQKKVRNRWCREYVTHCVLCSEDPRWCPPTM